MPLDAAWRRLGFKSRTAMIPKAIAAMVRQVLIGERTRRQLESAVGGARVRYY
jgi:hypothetical protein